MNQKAEEKAAPAEEPSGRTDKEKLADIGLSDEEVAALKGEDETAADKGEAGKDADKSTEKEGEDATKGESEAEKEAEAKAAAAATEEEKPEKVPDHFTPMAETLTEADLETIDTELKAIKQRFDDGDIDYEKYTDERLVYEKMLWHHEQAEMQNENAVEQRWQWERDWYMQANTELNQSQVIYGAFASQVNALLADEEWSTAPGFELLTEAHRRVASEIDSISGPLTGSGAQPNGRPTGGDKEDADKKAADALKKAKAAEAGKKPPETLAKVPAAEENKDVSKWAVIDALEGEELQKAIDKMSPADLKEYEEHH
jgi:hypothetical protein